MASYTTASIALPTELAVAIEEAARAEGKTVSDWITETVAARLRREAGQRLTQEWEAENGPFTPDELAAAKARVDALLAQNLELIEPDESEAS